MTLQTLDVDVRPCADERPKRLDRRSVSDSDGLDAIRGLALGVPLSLVLWAAIVVGLVWLT